MCSSPYCLKNSGALDTTGRLEINLYFGSRHEQSHRCCIGVTIVMCPFAAFLQLVKPFEVNYLPYPSVSVTLPSLKQHSQCLQLKAGECYFGSDSVTVFCGWLAVRQQKWYSRRTWQQKPASPMATRNTEKGGAGKNNMTFQMPLVTHLPSHPTSHQA